MKVNVDKSFAFIELSDGTKIEIDEKPYGSNNFLFIKVNGMEIFKMFLSENDNE